MNWLTPLTEGSGARRVHGLAVLAGAGQRVIQGQLQGLGRSLAKRTLAEEDHSQSNGRQHGRHENVQYKFRDMNAG
jgi:hypothetical protein